jgi:hypothetical protein
VLAAQLSEQLPAPVLQVQQQYTSMSFNKHHKGLSLCIAYTVTLE